jgi:hypothetical protein
MSLLKYYSALYSIALVHQLGKYPYAALKSALVAKEPEWDEKLALQNFKLICQAKPEELQKRICPKSVSQLTPFFHQGNLGFASKAECDAAIMKYWSFGNLAIGAAAFLLPVVRYFSSCLAQNGVGTCAESAVQDLVTFSGLKLFVGAFLISQFASAFLIAPVLVPLTNDPPPFIVERIRLLGLEYNKILIGLHGVLDLPAEDPKFIETALLAKQFIHLSPQIEQALHKTCALDPAFAEGVLLVLKTACRNILVKQSLAAQGKM